MDSYEAAEIARVRYMQYQAARHDTIQARVAEGLARRIARAAARTARATARWQRTDENPVQWETATRQATDHPTVVRFRRLQPGEPFTNALTRGEVIFNSHGNVVPINSRGEYAPALSGTTPQRATDVPPQVFADDGTPIKREDSDDREFPAAYSRDPVAFSDHIERKRRREVGEEEEAITGKKQKREASPKSDVTIKREEEDDVVTVWQAAPVTPIISLTSGTPITSLSPDFEAIALLRRLEDLDRRTMAAKFDRIEHQAGDVVDKVADGGILIHACNCIGEWGAGVALHLKKEFPEAYEVHHKYCLENSVEALMGTCQLIKPQQQRATSKAVQIACLFTSKGYGRKNLKKLNPGLSSKSEVLAATKEALKDFRKQLDDASGKEGESTGDIASVRFNAGAFKVPWEDTEAIIKDVFAGYEGGWVVVSPE